MSRVPVLSNQTAYDYLTRAQLLLEKPRYKYPGTIGSQPIKLEEHSWIRNAEAFSDALGKHVAPEDELASAWCTIGVLKAVTKYDPNPEAAYRYVYSIMNAANAALIAAGSAPSLNDVSDYKTVINLFENGRTFLLRHSQ
jgi:hypothetical protein